MKADDDMNPEIQWDEPRIALGRVGELFLAKPDFTLEELRGLEGYELIPEAVQETLEGLTPDDRQLLNRVFITLTENHLYHQDPDGANHY